MKFYIVFILHSITSPHSIHSINSLSRLLIDLSLETNRSFHCFRLSSNFATAQTNLTGTTRIQSNVLQEIRSRLKRLQTTLSRKLDQQQINLLHLRRASYKVKESFDVRRIVHVRARGKRRLNANGAVRRKQKRSVLSTDTHECDDNKVSHESRHKHQPTSRATTTTKTKHNDR